MSNSDYDDFWNDETQDGGFWKDPGRALARRVGRHAALPRFSRPATALSVLAGATAVAFGAGAVFGWLPPRSSAPAPGLASVGSRIIDEARPPASRSPSATVSPSRPPQVRAVLPWRPTASPIVVRAAAPTPVAPSPTKAPAKAPAPPPTKAPSKAPTKAPTKPPVTPAPVTHQISGNVQCATMAVEGVWIAAVNGGSGWATWTAAGSAGTASYSYTLPHGGSYAVHEPATVARKHVVCPRRPVLGWPVLSIVGRRHHRSLPEMRARFNGTFNVATSGSLQRHRPC
jgi:hypothetical protein